MTSTQAGGNARVEDGVLQLTLRLHDEDVTAVLSEEVWEARYGLMQSDASLREIYIANRPLIEAAIERRLQKHRRGHVVLRSVDL